MKSEAQEIVEQARKLPTKVREAANARWKIVYGELLDAAEAMPKKQRLKSFDVAHITARAREAFLRELVAGHDLEACRQAALQFKPARR